MMRNDTAGLLSSIDSSIQGLFFETETDYRLKPFVWDVSTQGEFNISRLLKSIGTLVAVELDDFLSWGEYLEDFKQWQEFLDQNPEYLTSEGNSRMPMPLSTRLQIAREREEEFRIFNSESAVMEKRYLSLLENIQTHVNELQVYRVIKYDEVTHNYDYSNDLNSSKDVFESFKILVGKVMNDCWIGISPISRNVEFPSRPTPERYMNRRILRYEEEVEKILSKLKPILDKLKFVWQDCHNIYSKRDKYAFDYAESKDELISRLLHSSNFLNTWEFKGMASGIEGVYLVEDGEKFNAIDELLLSNLNGLRFYVIGTISMFDIYVIGKTQSGDCLGFSTIAMWT
ncbi:nuclease A inhibitor family protein [Synechococcus sp. PCC 7336]|uniref:nuclease A inhibitor family protein n=1 Tax=Synechococcus sp. PCC 7336 TaxID=195250 RepID=UPI0003496D69|nr:nuclease A inhibitor family protein [Synechococcus sp. PCC 7336]